MNTSLPEGVAELRDLIRVRLEARLPAAPDAVVAGVFSRAPDPDPAIFRFAVDGAGTELDIGSPRVVFHGGERYLVAAVYECSAPRRRAQTHYRPGPPTAATSC
jgi:hypothetical protein